MFGTRAFDAFRSSGWCVVKRTKVAGTTQRRRSLFAYTGYRLNERRGWKLLPRRDRFRVSTAHQLAVRATTLFLPRSATVRNLEGFRYSEVVFSAKDSSDRPVIESESRVCWSYLCDHKSTARACKYSF